MTERNPADVQVTQADNNLLVKITEWLIREDAVDEENQKQLNRLGYFLEPLLARHRIAALQQSRSAVEAECAAIAEQYEHAWGEGNNAVCGLVAADIRALSQERTDA